MKFYLSIKHEGIYLIIKAAFKSNRNEFWVSHSCVQRLLKYKVIAAFQHNPSSHDVGI